jgi:glycosyltransferase involved in cell wall biosynthesis
LPDHIVTVSQTMCNQISNYPGIGHKVTAIRNAISCDLFNVPEQRDSCRSELGLSPNALVIGYTGRIQKVKRIDLLLLAFASVLDQYPDARLILAGEGDLKPRLEMYATQLGISKAVIWAGFRKDIPRLLAAMDIYVQPSINEGLSLSILEAMAAQKAVVATRVGGASEVIENEKTGMLVDPGSASNLAAAILYLFKHFEIRSKLANTARELVLRDFNTSRMANEYQQLYENLITGNSIVHHK